MRKLICAALAAAVSLSAVPATAQDEGEARKDYRDKCANGGYCGDRDHRGGYDRRGDDRRGGYDGRDGYRGNNDRREDYRDATGDAGPDYRKMRNSYDKSDRSWDKTGRGWQSYRNYDYNRYAPGQRAYYADQYYRDGSYYQPRRLGREDRIYRGSNGRYYCRRNDGTTGLIIGALAGGLLGNRLSNGRSSTLGTLLGVGGGAAIGSAIDRGQVSCR